MTVNRRIGVNTILKASSLLIIVSVLLPPTKIIFTFKPDLPLILFSSILLFNERTVARFPIVTWYKVLAAVLFVWMFIAGNYGNFVLEVLSKPVVIPTEYMQILSRTLAFYVFVYVGYRQIITVRKFIKFVSTVFILALLFAFLQVLKIPLIEYVSLNFYALTETQRNVFEGSNTRIFGTVGNAITWGGLAGFMFFFFYFLSTHKTVKFLGCFLSVISIIYSSSRAALFAFALVIVFIVLFQIFYDGRGAVFRRLFKKIIIVLITAGTALISALLLIPQRVATILLRIDNTESDLTERGRGAQVNFFWDLFEKNSEHFVFGIGKASLDNLGFMEIEPFFLLFAYGILGLILHYMFLVLLVKSAWKMKQYQIKYFLFILAGALFYFIFSFGFFFFREASSGLPFWWLCGYLVGRLYREKHTLSSNINGIISRPNGPF